MAASGPKGQVGFMRWVGAPLVAFLLLSLLWSGISAALERRPLAQEGVLDLRGWDFRHQSQLPLAGDWDFWRDQLVTPQEIADGSAPPPARLAVPGRWNNQSIAGQPLAAEGIGTYRLRVILPPGAPALALRHNQRFVAWNILINGVPTLYAGHVGLDADSTDSVGQKAIAAIAPGNGELDIIVQVAAFGGYGGMPRALLLGDADSMYGDWQAELALRAAFLSLCLSIGSLYLILFVLRPRDRICLVFAVMSIAIALVQVTSNTPLGSELLGDQSGKLLGLLNNIMFPAVWLSCLAGAGLLFPGCLRRGMLWPTVLAICAVPLASMFTLQFPWLLTAAATLGLVMGLATLLTAAGTAARRQIPLALPMAVAWIVLGLANLALTHRVGFTGVMEAGYCFMLLLQAAMLIDHLRHMLDQTQQSNAQLAAMNGALEDQVQDRTRHLTDTVDRLRLAQERLVQAEKLASLGRLVAGIAHEVNTPVGTALTTATHLSTQVRETEKAMRDGALTRRQLADFMAETREAASLLTATVERTAAIVQSFKQAMADRTDDRPRRFDLGDLLHDLRPTLETRLSNRNVTVTEDVRPGLLLDTYPGALTQVLGQLVSNCLDHAFPAGRPGHIQVKASAAGEGWVEIILEDDGVGIAPAIKPRLFEPFATTGRAAGRTGLGLHMVYTLVAGLLGGSIAISDRPGGGTRAIIRLPAADQADPLPPPPAAPGIPR
jgi:signal transduction histidine kinase